MEIDILEQPDFAELIRRSRTKANRLFFALVVMSALFFIFIGPRLVDTVRARVAGLEGISYAEAERNNELWQKNSTCAYMAMSKPSPKFDAAARREFVGHSRTMQNGDRITATVCESGDVFIDYRTPDGREWLTWVPADQAQRRQK